MNIKGTITDIRHDENGKATVNAKLTENDAQVGAVLFSADADSVRAGQSIEVTISL